MSKMYTGKIDVLKIDKAKLFEGKKGTYLDLMIWINDEPDKYGNHLSIQQHTKQGEDKIYLGNCKEFVKAETNDLPESESLDENPLPF